MESRDGSGEASGTRQAQGPDEREDIHDGVRTREKLKIPFLRIPKSIGSRLDRSDSTDSGGHLARKRNTRASNPPQFLGTLKRFPPDPGIWAALWDPPTFLRGSRTCRTISAPCPTWPAGKATNSCSATNRKGWAGDSLSRKSFRTSRRPPLRKRSTSASPAAS